MLKAFAALQATKKLSIDLDFVAASRSYARGNENNLSQPDGKYYLGPGTSPGYGVANLGARYQVRPKLQLFAQVNNLFDHHYYTGAQLGPTGFTDQGTFIARPFPAVNGDFPSCTRPSMRPARRSALGAAYGSSSELDAGYGQVELIEKTSATSR